MLGVSYVRAWATFPPREPGLVLWPARTLEPPKPVHVLVLQPGEIWGTLYDPLCLTSLL